MILSSKPIVGRLDSFIVFLDPYTMAVTSSKYLGSEGDLKL
ncbi:MAG: hypothetical protein ACI8RD_006582, partial [Bacillariaceae sp.]